MKVKMTEQEARAYIKLVHNTVDGKHIKLKSAKLKDIKKFTIDTYEHAITNAPMPNYNHAKYVEAMHMTSIHGDVKEPIDQMKDLIKDIKGFLKRLF